ncbi:MAG: PepSY domain-containing protein [Bacteroidales bacterium]|nr:PepSY domain-containing protein [Bacteroidales bacterium]
MKKENRKRPSRLLKIFREVHVTSGILLLLFFLILSVTGILLGWKKHSDGLIAPKSLTGSSTDLKDWLPVDSLHRIACAILHDSLSPDLSTELDRIDIRKDKGMVKFVFLHHYRGIQLDGATGELLQIEKRRSDLIENIHDMSVLDRILNTSNGQIKLVYTSIMGLALLTYAITGFWLWYLPKRTRRKKRTGETAG